MKAILYREYGSPDVLRYEEAQKPVPGEGQVLLRVRAVSLNPYDWHFMRGSPYFLRLMAGLRKPKLPSLGVDVAGDVEATGPNVRGFQEGDAVFGTCRGSFAEYACAAEKDVAAKPENVTFEEAAATPVAGCTALQGLRDKGRLRPGERVLVNGAAGGVGTFAVQIARELGAHVTGVCSTRNVELVQAIGADRVIDYTRQNFTLEPERYDVILDLIGNHSLLACRRVLTANGRYIAAGGPTGAWMLGALAGMAAMPLISAFGRRKLTLVLARPSQADLATIGDWMRSGKVKAVIDRRYELPDLPQGMRYLEEGHARGKVIVTPAAA